MSSGSFVTEAGIRLRKSELRLSTGMRNLKIGEVGVRRFSFGCKTLTALAVQFLTCWWSKNNASDESASQNLDNTYFHDYLHKSHFVDSSAWKYRICILIKFQSYPQQKAFPRLRSYRWSAFEPFLHLKF